MKKVIRMNTTLKSGDNFDLLEDISEENADVAEFRARTPAQRLEYIMNALEQGWCSQEEARTKEILEIAKEVMKKHAHTFKKLRDSGNQKGY